MSDSKNVIGIWYTSSGRWVADHFVTGSILPGFVGPADTIEVAPADIPALCEALGLVPRRALEIAVGYHADGMIAAGKAEDPPVLFDREGLVRIGIQRALDAAAKETTP